MRSVVGTMSPSRTHLLVECYCTDRNYSYGDYDLQCVDCGYDRTNSYASCGGCGKKFEWVEALGSTGGFPRSAVSPTPRSPPDGELRPGPGAWQMTHVHVAYLFRTLGGQWKMAILEPTARVLAPMAPAGGPRALNVERRTEGHERL